MLDGNQDLYQFMGIREVLAKLNEMIKDFRLSIDQSIEALALLMQMIQRNTLARKKTGIPC